MAILSFITFLTFFTTLANYFPVQQETITAKPLSETKIPSLYLNQFAKRISQRDLPNLFRAFLMMKHELKAADSPTFTSKTKMMEIYKVGRTTSTVGVDKRLKQWKRKCKKTLRLVKKFFVEENHELCESIIHLELKSKGVWCGYLSCETCIGSHKEFFKADLDTIIEWCYFWVDYFNELEKNKYNIM